MAESFKFKRVIFPAGKQKGFILKTAQKLRYKNREVANMLNICTRTLNDWKREKFSMSLAAVKLLSRKARIKMPSDIKIQEPFWYAKKGAKIGGRTTYKKYGRVGGDPEYRKKKWREWWEKDGRHKPCIFNTPLSFKTPKKSEKLAEFVGIMLGDGGISKYQLTVTLHHEDDKQYARFVVKLIKGLFGINPSIYHKTKNSVNTIVLSRIKLVELLHKEIGLKIGNKIKGGVDMPEWIKKNATLGRACLRGLMDTDGCLVIHTYRVNGKQYRYKKLNFCSASPALVASVVQLLKTFDFNPRLSHNGRNVWIEDQSEVARYLTIIGSNNPKHLERYRRVAPNGKAAVC